MAFNYKSKTQHQKILSHGYADISRLAVSTGTILTRFKKVNEGKPFDEQIKPFNFMHVGYGSKAGIDGEKIKPIVPFNKNPQIAVEKEFIDYNTGNTLQGRERWKTLVMCSSIT